MCVDYIDLNRACPKDCYPLPRIDQLVDATAGYELLTFMDAFSGYNQIRMAPQDQENTTFITDRGVYCYKVMPFGLKNAEATYQRMVDKLFKQQLGRNKEVYVDSMIVKSKDASTHLADLAETFQTLKWFNMLLNPAKCIFRVSSGKFLDFIIHQRGIDANQEKVRAITEMHPPPLDQGGAAPRREVGGTLQQILSKFDASGRMLRWSVELSEFDIQYSPRMASKAQVLADFISELTPEDHAIGQGNNESTWTLHVDGSATADMAGVGLILKSPSGETYKRSLRLQLRATNNEAEYEVLLHSLRLTLEMHVGNLEVFNNSQLVTGHVNDNYEARDPTMALYLTEVKQLPHRFNRLSVTRVPQAQNT
uniref:Uncharacterized protein n=1 Tax=Musa acuminata subsp. malaccensis TaxID=214687 RepID=A0A804J4Q5_MUSAM|nr:PREDICTED: uncharacterized protein LOC103985099 [Musa acuminata subsp. malaccensis]